MINRYRPEIDSLRATAVLCVIFFHLDFLKISGGFLGVDIFFVISGFLISNFIIGRINDFDLKNLNYKHWTKIREIQVKFAESNDKFSWVNTDDLNDGYNKKGDSINNDLHMSVEGYKTLGKRFAEKAIELIVNTN